MEWQKLVESPDVIHWNNGIWDCYRLYGAKEAFTPLNDYIRDMLLLHDQLKVTGARIIFATTTPVLDGCEVVRNEDIDLYNEAIVKRLQERGVEIHDLNAVIRRDASRYIQSEDKLHLTDEGYQVAGQAVATLLGRN